MKTIDFRKTWIVLIALPLFLGSCHADLLPGIVGEGEVVTEVLDLDEFNGFANTIAAHIYLSQGDEQEVVIEAQQNIIDNLELDRIVNGYWTIDYYRFVRRSKPIKIFITVPDLTKIVISGAGNVYGETAFTGLSEVQMKISGAGNMDMDLDCESLDVRVSGAGSFTLAGSAPILEATISGAGNVNAFDLETVEADFLISGAGSGELSVSDYLKASISGAGSLYYRGNPETDVHISGTGKVKRD